MDRFVSHFTNRVDAKGRVSIPASFRAVLAREGVDSVHLHPSLDQPALDAGGAAMLSEIDHFLSRYAPYSEAWESFSTALHGMSQALKLDPEGRIQLPPDLKAITGIEAEATFVGLGYKFQIWEPKRFAAHLAQARDRLRAFRRELGPRASSAPMTGEPSTGARE
jgi:MraZ protein